MPGDPMPLLLRLILKPGFNPRPASMPGDPAGERRQGQHRAVSIRARHQCRAIPTIEGDCATEQAFQSAPGINAGRSHQSGASQPQLRSFQSAPGINAGRSLPARSAWPRLGCFNPRPASMPGDPKVRVMRLIELLRFNPRPASMPGDPCHRRIQDRAKLFQSAPGINAGRSISK